MSARGEGKRFPHCILVHDLFEIQTDNCIEFKFQCQIIHGLEWNVESSMPIKTPYRYRHLSRFDVLRLNDFTKENFSSE